MSDIDRGEQDVYEIASKEMDYIEQLGSLAGTELKSLADEAISCMYMNRMDILKDILSPINEEIAQLEHEQKQLEEKINMFDYLNRENHCKENQLESQLRRCGFWEFDKKGAIREELQNLRNTPDKELSQEEKRRYACNSERLDSLYAKQCAYGDMLKKLSYDHAHMERERPGSNVRDVNRTMPLRKGR